MSAPLLGLPLGLALRELAERGVTRVEVNRLLAPGRAQAPDGGDGQWRVVRATPNVQCTVYNAQCVTLDVCRFAHGVGAASGRPPETENDCS
ncbi:MAG: hypothetical protein FWE77_02135 [Clostridia bacterium]|nr:hypothetical protein [Clostridia bacterium]